jgi:hypothetical protein
MTVHDPAVAMYGVVGAGLIPVEAVSAGTHAPPAESG